MSDRNAIIETLARAIHCHDGRLPTPWDADMVARWPDDCMYERRVAMSQAAAVLELVGPRKLEFVDRGATVDHRYKANTEYGCYYIERSKSGLFNWWTPMLRGKVEVNSLEAAQAAAQAHADAAHWANTKIGGV